MALLHRTSIDLKIIISENLHATPGFPIDRKCITVACYTLFSNQTPVPQSQAASAALYSSIIGPVPSPSCPEKNTITYDLDKSGCFKRECSHKSDVTLVVNTCSAQERLTSLISVAGDLDDLVALVLDVG